MASVEEEQSSKGAYNSEIVEEEKCNDLFEISTIREEEEDGMNSSLFSLDVNGKDCVYVCVGKSKSSMDALSWALKNCVTDQESTIIYLIHVFPQLLHIPSPCKLPKSQVNPEQVKSYMAQESGKRKELLQKFIYKCSASKIKVDTILIESDEISKAILDLIPILNMRMLVVGTTSKSSPRKSKSKKGIGIAHEIVENAPEYCHVRMISDVGIVSLGDDDDNANNISLPIHQQQSDNTDSFACMCFKHPKVM